MTLTQIKKGLEEDDSPEARGILYAIKVDPLLKEAIKTPFYLNTVQLLFSTLKPWEEFDFRSNSKEGRKDEIVQKFVEQSVNDIKNHTSNLTLKWLGFLGNRMHKQVLVIFELLDLQYNWSNWKKGQRLVAKSL